MTIHSRKSHGRRSLVGYSLGCHRRVGHDLATKQLIYLRGLFCWLSLTKEIHRYKFCFLVHFTICKADSECILTQFFWERIDLEALTLMAIFECNERFCDIKLIKIDVFLNLFIWKVILIHFIVLCVNLTIQWLSPFFQEPYLHIILGTLLWAVCFLYFLSIVDN